MTYTSCVPHPPNERVMLVRQWQFVVCEHDLCAAALLNFFEYWHSIKLRNSKKARQANDVAVAHGEVGYQDISLYQWHSTKELSAAVMGFTPKRIRRGIAMLENLGFISTHRNPNPRFKFDNTKHFLFHPEIVTQWLQTYENTVQYKTPISSGQTDRIDGVNLTTSNESHHPSDPVNLTHSCEQIDPAVLPKRPQQYPKTTTKTTTEITHKKNNTTIVDKGSEFDIFWEAWKQTTEKVSKREPAQVVFSQQRRHQKNLLSITLQALTDQLKEKTRRYELNLFVTQWPNPMLWLKEKRYLNQCLDESALLREVEQQRKGQYKYHNRFKNERKELRNANWLTCAKSDIYTQFESTLEACRQSRANR